MTPAPPAAPVEEVATPPVPWYRNPWVWGVIAGLVFVPSIRPFMRHIPEPPPVLAPVPEYELNLAGGGVARSSELLGRVYVVGMYGAPCEPDCSGVLPALTGLSERFRQFERGITVLAIRLYEGGDVGAEGVVDLEQEWLKLDVAPVHLDGIAAQVLAPHLGGTVPRSAGAAQVARQARVFLVDAAANLRGHYGTDEVGLDEVYHRAQHVLQDHRRDGVVLR